MRGSKNFMDRAIKREQYRLIRSIIEQLSTQRAVISSLDKQFDPYSKQLVLRTFRILDKMGDYSLVESEDSYNLIMNR